MSNMTQKIFWIVDLKIIYWRDCSHCSKTKPGAKSDLKSSGLKQSFLKCSILYFSRGQTFLLELCVTFLSSFIPTSARGVKDFTEKLSSANILFASLHVHNILFASLHLQLLNQVTDAFFALQLWIRYT